MSDIERLSRRIESFRALMRMTTDKQALAALRALIEETKERMAEVGRLTEPRAWRFTSRNEVG